MSLPALAGLLLAQAIQPAPVMTISASELARATRLTTAPAPVWRIGGDADGPYGFARIVGGTFMQNGRFAVLEVNPPEVRIYDGDGKHVLSFGRRGRGPGEFDQLQRIVPHAGDSLVVSQIARVSVFDGQGKHARTVSTVSGGAGLALVYRLFRDGSMLATSRPLPTARERPEGITRDSARLVILAPSDATVLRDLGYRLGGETVVARFDNAFAMTSRAFSAGSRLEGGDTVVFSMQSEAPRLDVLSARSGRLLRTLSFDLPSRAVTTRDKDEFVRRMRASMGNPQIKDAFLRVMTYPDRMPFFDALRWSFDGVVRLRRYTAALDTSAQWLSITSTGRLLNVIDVPAKRRVLDFDRDRVLVIERDADDLEYLALYRLVPRH